MIGDGYWASGIVVKYREHSDDWSASVDFLDDGFCQDDSTEGRLHTRYFIGGSEALTRAIDVVKADAERLGIRFGVLDGETGRIYAHQDGEDPEYPMPDGWRELLAWQSERIGWTPTYPAPAPTPEGNTR